MRPRRERRSHSARDKAHATRLGVTCLTPRRHLTCLCLSCALKSKMRTRAPVGLLGGSREGQGWGWVTLRGSREVCAEWRCGPAQTRVVLLQLGSRDGTWQHTAFYNADVRPGMSPRPGVFWDPTPRGTALLQDYSQEGSTGPVSLGDNFRIPGP